MWSYRQSTGSLYHDGVFVENGYSGIGAGLNEPNMQDVPDVGPIPEGDWAILKPPFDGAHGQLCLRLEPKDGTITFGRSEFEIHGDEIAAPGQHLASHGCIIMSHATRTLISESEDTDLTVIQ